MKNQGHKPILKGSRYVCADCDRLLLDITSPAKLRALTDVDQVKLGAVINRISSDPDLAERIATEDPRVVVSTYKLADKFNDFLMNPKARPDLQTPEAQHFLQILKHYHNPKTDPMMPWLAREWKKGRIRPSHGGRLEFDGGPDYEHEDANGNTSSWHNLTESGLDHWADWYGSDHPSRQGQDIMQMKAPEMHQTIEDWNRDMRSKAGEAAQIRGDVEHTYPDGWTVQRLTTPQQLTDEGDAMGHCVGSYAQYVQNGQSLIYSLRDHHNEPHATWEITPRWHEEIKENPGAKGLHHEGTPTGQLLPKPDEGYRYWTVPSPKDGTIEQIQGKGNEPPIPAYQKRIKEYFEHAMPDPGDRPKWEDQHIRDLDELMDPGGFAGYIAYHPGEYGLETPKTTFDWPEIMNRHIGFTEYEPDEVVQKALYHDQFPQMRKAAENDIAQRLQDRNEELAEEWRNYDADNWTNRFEAEDPHPELENFPGEKDNATYNKAYDEWEKRYEQAWCEERDEYILQREQQGFPEQEHIFNMETAIAAQQQREREGQTQQTTSKLETIQTPHIHFSTGNPCTCTFRKPESFGWRQAAFATDDPSRCPTCGDPLEHNKCQRCDWGGWSNAMGPNDPIADPTKEVKPAIQA